MLAIYDLRSRNKYNGNYIYYNKKVLGLVASAYYINLLLIDRLEVYINTIVKKGAYITLTHTPTHTYYYNKICQY